MVEIALLLFLLFLLAIYFLPTFIAGLRGHHGSVGIFALNLLLGWTGLGWIVALLWALTAVRHEEEEWEEEEWEGAGIAAPEELDGEC